MRRPEYDVCLVFLTFHVILCNLKQNLAKCCLSVSESSSRFTSFVHQRCFWEQICLFMQCCPWVAEFLIYKWKCDL